jgi:hypothetical protein
VGEPVEHEGIVGIRAVRQGDRAHPSILVARLTSHAKRRENASNANS